MSCNIGNNVTVMSPEGIPIQVNAATLQSASLQNVAGMIGIYYLLEHLNNDLQYRAKVALNKYGNEFLNLGNSATFMSPDGKPVQVNTAALQSAVAQNTTGILGR